MSFGGARRLSGWMAVAADTLTRSPLEIDDEARLLALAQAGDERAFRELVEPHRRALEVHAYRMLGSPQDAEDIVQETLMRAWRTLERFERRSSIETWLYRIATNACLDELERRPRRPEPRVDPYPDERLLEAPTPGRRSGRALRDARGRRARLPDRDPAAARPPARDPHPPRRARLDRRRGRRAARDRPSPPSTRASSAPGRRSTPSCPAESPTAAAPSQRELLAEYVDAWERADVDGLVALLREDAVICGCRRSRRSSATARSRSSSPGPRRATPARRSPPPRPRGPTAGSRS